ncbi:hypothetical protein PVK06_027317 [Gossypium arboreum]|uniref:Uncharacterized protein n=1 Tax=Gossypium arboreum TaxID=29729 RepID=A0ABR0P2V8_GOSAR|nr:hypothetical protein PVK06_027317 [Gossypium arboreum]
MSYQAASTSSFISRLPHQPQLTPGLHLAHYTYLLHHLARAQLLPAAERPCRCLLPALLPITAPTCTTPARPRYLLNMPRKRTRASAQIDKTQNKFYCEEARVRYESIFKNQQMHPEKGFTLKESNYRDFMASICQVAETLNWGLFCEKRLSMDKELVHEFYADLTSSEMTEVPVHGIKQRVEVGEEPEDPDEEEDLTMQSFEVLDKVESMEPEVEPDAKTSIFRAQSPSPDLRDELSKLMDLMQHMKL